MQNLTFKFSIAKSFQKTGGKILLKTVGIAALLVQGFAHAGDSKDDWIQYPPRAAVKLTEQINKFKDIEVDKKDVELAKGDLAKGEATKTEKVSAPEQTPAKESVKPKTLVSEDISWGKDHKTKTIYKKFSDGSIDTQVDIVEPVAGEPTYKGNLELIPMTYADGVKSIITRKAKSEEYEWAMDHTTKTTIYKFSDGTTNLDIKSVPKKYSQPEFKDGFEKITITFGDGTQKTEEYEAIDRKVSWSKDHLTQKITYLFEDGKSYDELVEVPKVVGTPVYIGDQERLSVTYGDGFKEEVILKPIDQKVSWSSDRITKIITYFFADGGKGTDEINVPRTESSPIYKGNLETIYYTYGDGTKTVLTRKAISEKVSWAEDHLTKTTLYSFADGSVNKVVSSVSQEVSKPIYEKDTQTITTKFGDGTVSTVVNKAIDEEVSWSEDHLYKTVTYKFSDNTTNQVVLSIPNQILPPTYKAGKETIKKIYGDGTEKVFTYDAISQKEVWSSDHESKVTVYKFADGTTHKEEMIAPKLYGQATYENDIEVIPVNYADGTVKIIRKKAVETKTILSDDGKLKLIRFIFEDGTVNDVADSSEGASQPQKIMNKVFNAKVEVHKPVYLQGLEIVTMTTSDGKTQTATYKAIAKDETWSSDGKTKFTKYKFEDGTTNTVTTDVITQMSKMPKPSLTQDSDDLVGHSLADD